VSSGKREEFIGFMLGMKMEDGGEPAVFRSWFYELGVSVLARKKVTKRRTCGGQVLTLLSLVGIM
jgi:hypothetical protein